MANKNGSVQAGYGNGGIDTMDQFEKLSDKITNSLKNLEFTRDMLRQLAENEKKSAKSIQQILNPLKQINKNKTLRFSVVDRAIQNYWKKQEQDRRLFAAALQTKIIDELDAYISSAQNQKKKLIKENTKIQRSFIECKKETAKQKQIGLKEWQKLEEQIQKNDQFKKTNKMAKIKDLKGSQDKCSKAFAKYESYVAKLNELEQLNHANACKVGELLHKSQRYAADRLSMHYNIAVSTSKYLNDFIKSNKSIVQSKAPPLTDILWRWLSYPKNHQTHTLPCTSQEVFSKQSIGQRFKRRVEPDYQDSRHLKPPKHHQKTQKTEETENETEKKEEKERKSTKKKHKKKRGKKVAQEPPQEEPQQPVADEQWDVDFGADDIKQIETQTEEKENGADADADAFAFGDDGGFMFDGGNNADLFSTPQQQKPIQNDLVQQHEEDATHNDFDAGFDDTFGDFGENKDLAMVDTNPSNDNAFGGDWNTDFDENLFTNTDNDNKPQQTDDVDDLFGGNDFGDIDGDIFASNKDKNDDNNDTNDNDGNTALFDDEFDDDREITFPEFDSNIGTVTNTKTKTKQKRKSKLKKSKLEIVETEEPQSSPQPNEITSIPEPVISFDAPINAQKQNESIDIDDDNPFGVDLTDDGADVDDSGADDIDADNPFAMFDEPDDINAHDNHDATVDDFDLDPFG